MERIDRRSVAGFSFFEKRRGHRRRNACGQGRHTRATRKWTTGSGGDGGGIFSRTVGSVGLAGTGGGQQARVELYSPNSRQELIFLGD